MDLRHDPERHRFVAKLPGGEAELEYTERGAVLDYRHTFTPPALRGQGIARALVLFALEHAREHGIKIVPSCPYVAKVVADNPQYADLVAAADA
ncbi:MAG TPA: GNAT family N-acetyltransferase [Gammaproteobacteria bacterium]|nr:GNAT family N-acetyltransferase [Gammaproteobacteria bacterium]